MAKRQTSAIAVLTDYTNVTEADYAATLTGESLGGAIIFNTDLQYVRIWNGTEFENSKPFLNNIKKAEVRQLSDLPEPISGIITLEDFTTYIISGTVDISPNRIVTGLNTLIIGVDRFSDILLSNTTGALLTATTGRLSVFSITLRALNGSVFNLTGMPLVAVEIFAQGATLGNFNATTAVTFRQSGFNNAVTLGGATFTGTCGSFRFFDNIGGNNPGVLFDLGTATFTNIIIDRNMIVLNATQTFISGLTAGGNLVSSGVISNNIFSGSGTYMNGITINDSKWRFINNSGIADTEPLKSEMYMIANAIPTIITSILTPVKILGSTIAGILYGFTHTLSNRLTYIGTSTKIFKIDSSIATRASSNNQVLRFNIYKNGVLVPNLVAKTSYISGGNICNASINGFISLSTNDYIEVYVRNETSTANVTVDTFNLNLQ